MIVRSLIWLDQGVLTSALAVFAASTGACNSQEDVERAEREFRKTGAGAVQGLGMLPSKNVVVIGSKDGIVRLWDAITGKITGELDAKAGAVMSLAVDPKEKWIAVVYKDKSMCIWD